MLLFAPKRKYFDNDAHWGEIPSAESEVAIIRQYGSKVIALAMHTEGCSPEEIRQYQQDHERRLGIPVLLPIQEGVGRIIPELKKLAGR